MSDKRVIGTAAVIAVGVGSANAVAKHKRLPSAQFLIGSGVAFMLLSAMAEAEPEIAKAFAVAIATTVLLGDGGGVLSYIDTGELDTRKTARTMDDAVGAKTPARQERETRQVPLRDDSAGVVVPFVAQTPRRSGVVGGSAVLPPYRRDSADYSR